MAFCTAELGINKPIVDSKNVSVYLCMYVCMYLCMYHVCILYILYNNFFAYSYIICHLIFTKNL